MATTVLRRAAPLEKQVQEAIVRLLTLAGCKVYRLGRPARRANVHKGTGQTPGIPDLYVLLPLQPAPVALWVEVKRPGEKLRRPAQIEFRRLTQRTRGVWHEVWRSAEDCRVYLMALGLLVIRAGHVHQFPGQHYDWEA